MNSAYFQGWGIYDTTGVYRSINNGSKDIDNEKVDSLVRQSMLNNDKFLVSAYFDTVSKQIVFNVKNGNNISVDISNITKDKQDKLTAGQGIQITSDNVINVDLDNKIFVLTNTLPLDNIENKIYLIPSAETENENIYTEYLYVDNSWEKLGEVKANIDMSVYMTSDEANSKFLTEHQDITMKANAEDVQLFMDNTSNQLSTLMNLKADKDDVYTKEDIDDKGFITEHQDISTKADKSDTYTKEEITEYLEEKISWNERTKNDSINYKVIVLDNNSNVLGKGTDGTEYNIAEVSKWNVADFGSRAIHLNLNGSQSHPTYNDSKPIALVEDIPSLDGYITATEAENTYYHTNIANQEKEVIEAKYEALKEDHRTLQILVGDLGAPVVYNVESFDEINTLLKKNGTIKLQGNINGGIYAAPSISKANNITLNLNGHEIESHMSGRPSMYLRVADANTTITGSGRYYSALEVSSNPSQYSEVLIRVDKGNLTINGSATYEVINNSNPVILSNGSNAVINIKGGTFKTNDCTAVMIQSGTVNITGGTFKCGTDDKRYLINCNDSAFASGTANVSISSTSKTSGPKFYGFDPSANPEGENTSYVADGCHVISSTVTENDIEYIVYTVVKD